MEVPPAMVAGELSVDTKVARERRVEKIYLCDGDY
jgi:hypothetical protein